ncbi:hypothetical protein Q1695_004217 [Nippostrongylus brasiliensis]|nr:hypothetical protein Q1695_004217 [Nippostrongylus brasiliensis]
MLLTVFSVALLLAPCVSKNVPRPGFAAQLPQQCPGVKYGAYTITLSLFTLTNELRWRIASGQNLKDMQNQGGPMYGVRWSCILEANATTLLGAGETSLPHYVVLSFNSTKGSSRAAKIKDVFGQMKADPLGHSTLSSPNVTYFGCAYSYSNPTLRVLCVFSSESNEGSSGHSSCSSDSDCTLIQGSTCSDKLCWAPSV